MQSNLARLSKHWRALTNNFYAKPQIIAIRIMKPSATSNKAYISLKHCCDVAVHTKNLAKKFVFFAIKLKQRRKYNY